MLKEATIEDTVALVDYPYPSDFVSFEALFFGEIALINIFKEDLLSEYLRNK